MSGDPDEKIGLILFLKEATVLKADPYKKTVLHKISPLVCWVAIAVLWCSLANAVQARESALSNLEKGFADPPQQVGVRCWWWWLNSNVTKGAITRDLEEMKAKGFSGAMIFDAGTELRWGPDQPVPNGPMFAGPAWLELFGHALKEAQRLGLELGVSIQSGWNLGGPNVTPDFAAKQLTWSEVQIKGPSQSEQRLPLPKTHKDYYRDICVLAYPSPAQGKRRPIKDIALKAGYRELGGSAPDCRFLLNDHPAEPGEEDTQYASIQNISDKLAADGTSTWTAPPGQWTIIRFGYTLTQARVKTSSDNWQGLVLDYLSRDAFERYWNDVVTKLLKRAGPLAGTVLKQLETDSWECGGMNWSPHFATDFKKFRGYDPLPYLPVIAGKIVDSRDKSNAFLADFRKTLGDCVADNHYRSFAEFAHLHNIEIQPESGGPHAGPLDAIKNLGRSDIIMGEFWAPSPHRPKPVNRFFIKQAASVAHIYGKELVAAESFTTIGPHWNDVLWQSQKPSMDHEFCSGLNAIYFHTFTCSPPEMGIPGQEYFAGTHVNPQVTWWDYAGTFIDYINRCQFLVRQGDFVADVLYYYGDHVPNLAQRKEADPAQVLPGYDYDVTNEEILMQLRVESHEIAVPGGIRYRLLVLPDHQVLSLAALEKVADLLQQGATVLGPKPLRLVSLVGGADSQQRFKALANRLWGDKVTKKSGQRQIGKGRLIWGETARAVLARDSVKPDCEFEASEGTVCDYIHYTVDNGDVYFVCNQTEETADVLCNFRIAGKTPQLWDPVTGKIQRLVDFRSTADRTSIPLRFGPYGSLFVMFENIAPDESRTKAVNYREYKPVMNIAGPWQVSFDTQWGGPAELTLDKLISWTDHPDAGVKYYSGKATYRTAFGSVRDSDSREECWLDLGEVKDIGVAQVTLNGQDLGVVWTKPFRVDITDVLQAGENQLEINVVNSWRNRLVGDRGLAPDQRYTKTNITIRKNWKVLESGLLGPVRILSPLSGLSGLAEPAQGPGKPNILLIMADDMGYSDAECYGGDVRTPNLSRLAAQGIRFTQHYSTGRCWPSRACILTGFYAQQIRRDALPGIKMGKRPTWAPLLPQRLRPLGYSAYHSGKWHIDGTPQAGGFERSWGGEKSGCDWDRFFDSKPWKEDEFTAPVKPGEEYYSTVAIADHAIQCLRLHQKDHGTKPFFQYVAFYSPHFPLHALQKDIDAYGDTYGVGWDVIRRRRWQRMRDMGIINCPLSGRDAETVPTWNLEPDQLKARIGAGEAPRAVAWETLTEEQQAFQAKKMAIHAAMITRMDLEIGRIIQQLKDMGAFENTLILFASDNGASAEQIIRGDDHDPSAPPGSAGSYLCLGPGWSTAANTPIRLHKHWNHEGGISSPLIAHWPRGISARGELRHDPSHFIDIAPTIMALADATRAQSTQGTAGTGTGAGRPGQSLVPAFAQNGSIQHERLWWCHAHNRALRQGDWKLSAKDGKRGKWELYNLKHDRCEMNNLAAVHPERVAKMVQQWEDTAEGFRRDLNEDEQ